MQAQEHGFHEIFLLLRGRSLVHSGDAGVFRAGPGSLVVIPAESEHRFIDEEATNLLVVALSEAALDNCPGRRELWKRVVAGHRERPGQPCRVATEQRAWRELLALERRPQRPDHRIRRETLLNMLLCDVAASLERPRNLDSEARLRRFLRDLPERLHESWSLDRAAAAVGLSRRRFSELFRQRVGESFVPHLQRLRVGAVQRLLRGEEHSIIGAAYSCGFEDTAHFYRVFRRYTGESPGAWLRTAGGDAPAGSALDPAGGVAAGEGEHLSH